MNIITGHNFVWAHIFAIDACIFQDTILFITATSSYKATPDNFEQGSSVISKVSIF